MTKAILKITDLGYHVAFCRIRATNRIRFCITAPISGNNVRCDVPEIELSDEALLKVFEHAKRQLDSPHVRLQTGERRTKKNY